MLLAITNYMSPVDSVIPPQKKDKAKNNSRPVNGRPKKKAEKANNPAPVQTKERTMWILVIIFTIIIFLIWLLFFQGQTTNSTDIPGLLQQLGDKTTSLWQTLKTDILKIKPSTTNEDNTSDEEKIKNLEEKVFPQFTDPNKQ